MIFRQFIDEDLGCASYLIGDAGEAAVIDPSWDVTSYREFAAAHRLRITRVFETHTHADHVSGRGRIAATTGVELFIPAGAGVVFPHVEVHEGSTVRFGAVRITAIATPGHRPEHIAFAVTDTSRGDEATIVLSGDSLLVGDVARPDLATTGDRGIEQAARALFGSVHRLGMLADHVELWPGHIGGSLCCGAGTSEKPSSTIGLERRTNPAMTTDRVDRFVDELIARIPERPATVDRVVELNRGRLIADPPPLASLGVDEVEQLIDRGAAIVDGRSAAAFDEANIPGSLCLPLDRPGIGSRAAWLVEPDQPLVLLADDDHAARRLASRLAAVGLLNVQGHIESGVRAWQARGRPLSSIGCVDVETAASLIEEGAAIVVDVRDADERGSGTIAGSLLIPWRELRARAVEAHAPGKSIVVVCATGGRTPTAASLLNRLDGPQVLRLAEGGIVELDRQLRRALHALAV